MKDQILEWANERGLLNPDFAAKQMMKLTEEVGEIASAILKNKPEEQADGIGDAVVVLTILANQLGLDIDLCVKGAYQEIQNRKGKLVGGTFIKE